MKRKPRQNQQGVALLMVLIALTILGTMTADLMESNEVYLSTTVNARDAKKAEYMAKSGVNLARLTLTFKELLGNTSMPFWQYADMLISTITDKSGGILGDLTGADLSGAEGLGLVGIGPDDELKVDIIDEDSKLNINMANAITKGNSVERMVRQLSSLMAPEEFNYIFEGEVLGYELSTREDIICEIIDWSDGNEDLCDMSGNEDRSLYTSLEPPYERKNAPFDSVQELFLVSGVSDDFWSAFADPDPEDPKKRIMTVWGKGRINVNTAPLLVLLPIVCDLTTDASGVNACQDPAQIANIALILQMMQGLRTLMPFSNYRDFMDALQNPERIFLMGVPGVVIPPEKRSEARRMLTTSSTVFSIYATATVGRVTKRIHVVVDTANDVTLDLPDEQKATTSGGKVLYYRME